jgi:hypothetical protein
MMVICIIHIMIESSLQFVKHRLKCVFRASRHHDSHHFHECNRNLGYCSYNCLPKTLSRSFVYLSIPAIHGVFLLTFEHIVKLLVLAQLNQQPPMQHHPLEACYDSIVHEPQLS